MKKYFWILLLFAANSIFAQGWASTTGKVGFKIKMFGVNVDGTFKGLKTNFKFEGNEPQSLSATIDTKTVNTENSLRDKHLTEKEDFFQPELFPTISMTSVSIQKGSGSEYVGVFKITIKGISKNLKIPFTFTNDENKGVLKTNFTLNRENWNFGGSTPGMSDNVNVSILVNLEKK